MYAASSREALEGTRVELEASLRGAADPAGAAATAGDELLSVATVVSGDRALRSALADSATAPAERARVAEAVLTGKVSDITCVAVASAASRAWSSESDLVAGLQSLGCEALLQSARDRGRLDSVQDELFRLGRIVKANTALEQALSERSRPVADRVALLKSLVAGKVDPVTERLAILAVSRTDVAPGDALDELSQLAAASAGRKVAYVTSAGELSADQREQLGRRLAEIFSAPITLHVEIDPELLGGLVVRVGDERIDGSIAGRIANLRRSVR